MSFFKTLVYPHRLELRLLILWLFSGSEDQGFSPTSNVTSVKFVENILYLWCLNLKGWRNGYIFIWKESIQISTPYKPVRRNSRQALAQVGLSLKSTFKLKALALLTLTVFVSLVLLCSLLSFSFFPPSSLLLTTFVDSLSLLVSVGNQPRKLKPML